MEVAATEAPAETAPVEAVTARGPWAVAARGTVVWWEPAVAELRAPAASAPLLEARREEKGAAPRASVMVAPPQRRAGEAAASAAVD